MPRPGLLGIMGAGALGLLALGVAGQPGAVVVALLGLAFGLAACRLLVGDRGFLTGLFLAAYLSRLAVAAALYYLAPLIQLDELVPDAARFDLAAWVVVQRWHGEPVEPSPIELYDLVLAITYWATGRSTLTAAFLNAGLAAVASVLVAATARRLFGERVGRVTGVAVACFPSVFFWSVVPLREALYTFLVALCIWGVVGFVTTWHVGWCLPALAGWWALKDVRYYAFLLICLVATVAVAAALATTRRRALVAGALLLVAVVVGPATPGVGAFASRFLTADVLVIFERQRADNAVGAGSAFVSPVPPAATTDPLAPPSVMRPVDRLPQDSSAPCTGTRIIASPPSPQPRGTPISLLATVTGCGGAVEYRWFEQDAGNTWRELRGWGGPTLELDTSRFAAGPSRIAVWVRRSGADADWDTYTQLSYVLTADGTGANAGAHAVAPPAVHAAPALPPPDPSKTSLQRTLEYLPTGLAHLLGAPFPWAATKVTQWLTIPDMLLWYASLLLAGVGLWLARGRWRLTLFPLGYVAGMLLALLLTEGNTGTLFRHRAMVIPFLLPFSVVGGLWLWDRLRDRRGNRPPGRPVAASTLPSEPG
jgi:hypothetical protein